MMDSLYVVRWRKFHIQVVSSPEAILFMQAGRRASVCTIAGRLRGRCWLICHRHAAQPASSNFPDRPRKHTPTFPTTPVRKPFSRAGTRTDLHGFYTGGCIHAAHLHLQLVLRPQPRCSRIYAIVVYALPGVLATRRQPDFCAHR